jgi:hypothetical protein
VPERDRAEYEEKLVEQLTLLDQLGRLYDEVTPAAALPLATSLRVILHNTANSHALLALLGELDSTRFLDTASRRDARNLIRAHNGLVLMQVSPTGGVFVPRCSAPANGRYPNLLFVQWWQAMVICDSEGREWTRKSAVLALANKEGGAHIDPRRPSSVRALESENSMGWVFTRGDDGTPSPFTNGPLAPTVRQIAYEVVTTLTGGDLDE